jgi:Type II secretory pathway, ATPase PulE/Tfp pilus assembly pathway, ATPase PilB
MASSGTYMGQIGQRLLTAGLITQQQLAAALERKRQTGGFLGEVMIEMGYITANGIGKVLEEATGVPYVDLNEVQVDPRALELVSEQYQRRHRVLPYTIDNRKLHVAMGDPLNVMIIDDLRLMTGLQIVPMLALQSEIMDAFGRAYSARSAAESVLKEIENAEQAREDQELSVDQLVDLAEDAPIIRLVNSIIAGAINGNASDIHIEPQEKAVRVRYRVDWHSLRADGAAIAPSRRGNLPHQDHVSPEHRGAAAAAGRTNRLFDGWTAIRPAGLYHADHFR